MRKKVTERDNFAFLAVALVLLLSSAAVVDQFASGNWQRLVQAATIVTLAIAVWSLKNERAWYRTGIGFLVAIVVVAVLGQALDRVGLEFAHLGILLGFFTLTAWIAARQVLFTGPIDRNKILGAICIYLLLGLIWAVLYAMIALFTPTAFNGPAALPLYEIFPDYVYFSFVSLTTLGFGDITPVAPVTRFLVYAEALVGQFYLAILVASLVGVRISGQHPNSP
ncbi:MAG: two pore domain potassium channel family protein [Pseudomonadota bacterium]|nr:MAG: two pore domain potassium channel family protein [Pseudomonadota bacterium]